MRVLAIAAALLALAAGLWAAGELHRQNCLRAGRAGCSVLPWQSGHPKHHYCQGLSCDGFN